MDIAQFAPLHEAVPPKTYGGTERVVSYLTEELIAMGHNLTLFASGDSVTKARLIAGTEQAMRLDPTIRDLVAPHILMLETAFNMAHEFDVMHFHMDYWPFSLFRRQPTPFVTTLHGRLDFPEQKPVFRHFHDVPVISISDAQRKPLPEANFVGTVHHGLPQNLLTPQPVKPSYLAFLGRICPEKGPDRAIRIARACGMKLKIAAKVDKVDVDYYEDYIKPMIDGVDVEFIGEITEAEKPEFLSGAHALLATMEMPEPFGLVLIEALACGAPVIAWRRGSVPEVIEPGKTGYIIESEDEGVAAVRNLDNLWGRERIRRRFEERFTARRMAEDYVALYRQLIALKAAA